MSKSANFFREMQELMGTYFSLGEFRSLCFFLNIDYDELPGEYKTAKIESLLHGMGRAGRLPELLKLVDQERPHANWPPMPEKLEMPTTLSSGGTISRAQQITIFGDYVHGDKLDGDQFNVDKIENPAGLTIGRGGSATVQPQPENREADWTQLFAPLLFAVAQEDETAVATVLALKNEVSRGETANDETLAELLDTLAEAVPAAVDTLIALFKNPAAANVTGPISSYVLNRLGK